MSPSWTCGSGHRWSDQAGAVRAPVACPLCSCPAVPADPESDGSVLIGVPGLLPLLLASVNDGVLLADAQGRLTYCNAAAEHLLGSGLTELALHDLPHHFGMYHYQSGYLLAADEWPLTRAVRGEESGTV